MGEGREEGLTSLDELLDQIQTNKKHFQRRLGSSGHVTRSSKSASELQGLPTIRENDVNDPDTLMLLCLPWPVMRLQAIRRRINSWVRNLLWPRRPLPCVGTSCGPVFHVRSCDYHPLRTTGRHNNWPIRRSTSN